ncbi:hypothetical protein SAMN05421749_102236 [Acinetobacter marinus]|uniref:DUF2147 domain-containing protein n=1 Tax=Acinetobacter marinus TaxID=281375 RepID=A0A1G6HGX1_9GAMM|nr:DUF2147 domain-containing protein [Acinetobacter marinus]SDB93490.1 hypothetical protein SAMN05421749_102236 [Acinetobacter marinus]
MKQGLLFSVALMSISVLSATTAWSIELDGTKWQAMNEKTGKPLNIIQFYKDKNGNYAGKVAQVSEPKNIPVCTTCSGELKGKNLQGMTLIRNLKKSTDNKYTEGSVIDPASSRTYRLNVETSPNGQQLKLRGYIGTPALAGTQIWNRVK